MENKRTVVNEVMRLIGTSPLFSIPRKCIGDAIVRYYASKDGIVFFYNTRPEHKDTFHLIKMIRKETDLLLTDLEAHQIFQAVTKTKKISGDIAEVGSYKGGSAKLICSAETQKHVYLFDTFEGLPEPTESDKDRQFYKGDYAAPFEMVQNLMKDHPNAHLYKGIFPQSAEPIENKIFSFVHLDVDLYESTLESLRFFYPRMNRGGIILSHDYPGAQGVMRAFDEFFHDKPEPIIELPGCKQCLITKI